jgi:hypothetical protein
MRGITLVESEDVASGQRSGLEAANPDNKSREMVNVATFAHWLTQQENRTDRTGELARWWKSYEGNRPKRSSPSGIETYLREQGPQAWEEWGRAAWAAMLEEWHTSRLPSHLQIVRETPDQAMVTLGAIRQALAEMNLRLSAIESNLQVIGAHAGVDWIEPEAQPEPAPADLIGPGWPEIYRMARFDEEAAGDG